MVVYWKKFSRPQEFCNPHKRPVIPVKTCLREEHTVGNDGRDEKKDGNAPILYTVGIHGLIIKYYCVSSLTAKI